MNDTPTPRTDARVFDADLVSASFARELERELAEIKTENTTGAERLRFVLDENAKLREERENWRVSSVCSEALAEVEKLRDASLKFAVTAIAVNKRAMLPNPEYGMLETACAELNRALHLNINPKLAHTSRSE